MWKKLALMTMVLTLISVFTVPSAEAGSKHQRVLKTLFLGGLFAALPPPPPVVISPAPEHRYYLSEQEYIPDHWEMSREWISEPWERV